MQRDWLSIMLQFVIIVLLAVLSLLSATALTRMDEPRDLRIVPTNPQPQPQLEAHA